MNFEIYEKAGHAEYAALAEAVADILFAALAHYPDVRLQHIQRRAKAPASLRRKLEQQGALESAEIEAAAKDLAGVRVVLYTNADVDRFLSSGILRDNFDINWDRTKIHHPPGDPREATELFSSNNYFATLKDARVVLPEYARFAGLGCEIQVQTTLNHAWSEMAHDTIYKKRELAGFGSGLMRGIEDRMKTIMRKYLAPAGHEFQKVVIDAERLASGRELFDRGALEAIDACGDNNERYDVLERFFTYVLPHYDDPGSIAREVLQVVAQAVKQARETEARPIKTPFGSLPGHTSQQIASLAARVVHQLRYADIILTFDVAADLHETAQDPDERKLWIKTAEALATHDLGVWRQAGPLVQVRVVDHIRRLPRKRLLAIQPVAVAALAQVLRSDVSGTTMADYKTFTIEHGAVLPGDELRKARAGAIDLLTNLFKAADRDATRHGVIHALANACAMPGRGQPSVELMVDILGDACRIVDFYTKTVSELSFELRQKLEHDLYWMHRRNQRSMDRDDENQRVTEARESLRRAILAFRDQANADSEFVIYKTLVGFQSVFPPAWEDPENHHADEDYRAAAIERLVAGVTPGNGAAWLERIRRCAATESEDLATFPSFGRFLEALGRAQPGVMIGFLEQADAPMARFLTSMLSGLVDTPQWPRAEATVAGWIDARRYLGEVAWSLGYIDALDESLLERVLDAAIETGNDTAVLSVISAARRRYEAAQGAGARRVALAGIRHLGNREQWRWVNAWTMLPHPERDPLLHSLEEPEAQELLGYLVGCPRIEYYVEDLVAAIATHWPNAVIAFFGDRLDRERTETRTLYDAVPYQFHGLSSVLAPHLEGILVAARRWFEAGQDLFGGTRLLTGVFPGLSEKLEALLAERVESGDRDEIAFVLAILRSYNGETSLHPLCKDIVAALPDDDELLQLASVILDSMGVTTGEFGHVEGLRRKRVEIEPWLEDPRERVRLFATRHLHALDQRIAAEQRRGEEALALRKLEYGDSEDDGSDAT